MSRMQVTYIALDAPADANEQSAFSVEVIGVPGATGGGGTFLPQANNTFFSGPISGGPTVPTFRVIDKTDLPVEVARQDTVNSFLNTQTFQNQLNSVGDFSSTVAYQLRNTHASIGAVLFKALASTFATIWAFDDNGNLSLAGAITATTATQAPLDNSTKLASTAYVDHAVSAGGGGGVFTSTVTATVLGFNFSGATTTGFGYFANSLYLQANNVEIGCITGSALGGGATKQFQLDNGGAFTWNSGGVSSTVDTGITRSSAGIVEVNNGTAGTQRDLLLRALTASGGITPASMTDSAAANGTLYFSTTASKLVYKDSGGTVNALY